jgi:hypothetical protein
LIKYKDEDLIKKENKKIIAIDKLRIWKKNKFFKVIGIYNLLIIIKRFKV